MDNLPRGNFSEAERLVLRELMRDLDRGRWLRRQIKRWSLFLIGIPVTIWATWQAIDSVVHAVTALLRRGP